MNEYLIERGATSVILHVYIEDSGGGGKTGLTSASSGLIIAAMRPGEASATAYTVAGSTIESITTIGTYAAPSATKIRFKEIDATNMPGWYEVQAADALFNTTGTRRELVFVFSGASGMVQATLDVHLLGVSLHASGVTVTTNNDKAGYFIAAAGFPVGGFDAGAITEAAIATGAITSAKFAAGAVDAAAIAADAIGSSEFSQAAADKVWGTTTRQLTGTQAFNLTGNITGSITGNLSGSVGSVSGAVGSITGVTFPSGFSSLTVAAIADGVWDEARSGHTTSGTFGQGVASVQGGVTGAVASVTAGVTLTSPGIAAIFAYVIEGAFTFEQLARGWSAALLGDRSGGATSTLTLLGVDGSTVRITMSNDASGNTSSPTVLVLS